MSKSSSSNVIDTAYCLEVLVGVHESKKKMMLGPPNTDYEHGDAPRKVAASMVSIPPEAYRGYNCPVDDIAAYTTYCMREELFKLLFDGHRGLTLRFDRYFSRKQVTNVIKELEPYTWKAIIEDMFDSPTPMCIQHIDNKELYQLHPFIIRTIIEENKKPVADTVPSTPNRLVLAIQILLVSVVVIVILTAIITRVT